MLVPGKAVFTTDTFTVTNPEKLYSNPRITEYLKILCKLEVSRDIKKPAQLILKIILKRKLSYGAPPRFDPSLQRFATRNAENVFVITSRC